MLTKEIQIKIFNNVLIQLKDSNIDKLGLCTLLRKEIKKELYLIDPFYEGVNSYIPLFTRYYAKYANACKASWCCLYWWLNNEECYDVENRIKFLEWIINELKK